MKKIFKIVILIFLIVFVFLGSYFISYNKFAKVKKDNNTKYLSAKSVNSDKAIQKVSKKTKIIFKVYYKKSGKTEVKKELESPGKYYNMTKDEIDKSVKDEGYKVELMSPSSVILVSEVNRYLPDKYVIDIYNNECLAIFKTDNNGNEFIEDEKNDIKYDTKISNLRSGDLNYLEKGDPQLQYDSKEAAEESYMEIYRS